MYPMEWTLKKRVSSHYNVPNGVDTKKKSVFTFGTFLCIII